MFFLLLVPSRRLRVTVIAQRRTDTSAYLPRLTLKAKAYFACREELMTSPLLLLSVQI